MFPFGNLEEMGKQNMTMFESAAKAFSPVAAETGAPGTADAQNSKPTASEADTLAKLKEQVDLLQKQLESLSIQQRSAQEGERD
jgi:polyhydroxyalkanoate synthesis regulator protein